MTLRKTNKGSLAKELQNNVQAAYLLDGMALASKGWPESICWDCRVST